MAGGGGGGGFAAMPITVLQSVMKSMPPYKRQEISQVIAMKKAAETGIVLVHDSTTCSICASSK